LTYAKKSRIFAEKLNDKNRGKTVIVNKKIIFYETKLDNGALLLRL
jgi:hypothetical protein